jgi:hypothetical protein
LVNWKECYFKKRRRRKEKNVVLPLRIREVHSRKRNQCAQSPEARRVYWV